MPEAISNTSPLLYLYRVEAIDWLSHLFNEIWIPGAVSDELEEGRRKGYDVPIPSDYDWLHVVNPQATPWECFVGFGSGRVSGYGAGT